MKKILIADDHSIVRAGLKQIVSEEIDMEVFEASSGQEVLDFLKKSEVDVLILDISMPEMSGLEVLEYVSKEYPRLPVLMLSVYPEDQYAIKSLKMGASGYLTKDSAPERLVKAIKTVFEGKKYVSQTVADRLIRELSGETSDDHNLAHETLSEREMKVMKLIGSGNTVSEIAKQLDLGKTTVSTYRARILKKLRLQNTIQLIRYVVDNDLTS